MRLSETGPSGFGSFHFLHLRMVGLWKATHHVTSQVLQTATLQGVEAGRLKGHMETEVRPAHPPAPVLPAVPT